MSLLSFRSFSLPLCAAVGLVCSSAARADLVMNVLQLGPNIVVSARGSANTSGLNPGFLTFWATPFLGAQTIEVGSGVSQVYTGFSGPVRIGPGTSSMEVATTDVTGGPVGLLLDRTPMRLMLPRNYVSGSPISSSAIYAGRTFAGVGLNNGSYRFTWGSGATADSLTINVAVAPEPSTWAMLLMSGAAAAFLATKRRRT